MSGIIILFKPLLAVHERCFIILVAHRILEIPPIHIIVVLLVLVIIVRVVGLGGSLTPGKTCTSLLRPVGTHVTVSPKHA